MTITVNVICTKEVSLGCMHQIQVIHFAGVKQNEIFKKSIVF